MEDGGVLHIKIRSSDGNDMTFKVKGRTPFQKIFNTYCEKTSQEPELLRFLYDEKRVRGEQTPMDYEMEDGDVIDCMVTQVGGGGCHS